MGNEKSPEGQCLDVRAELSHCYNTLKDSGSVRYLHRDLICVLQRHWHRRSKRRGWEVLGFVCKFENASLGHIFFISSF